MKRLLSLSFAFVLAASAAFAQAFGNGRGEGTVEFSLSEQGFYGGADGHISPLFALLSPL